MREAVFFEVFLDLQKAYYALYWDRCLDIIAAYGVGPSTLQLLWTYWDQLTMVVRASGYFRRPLKWCRGVTQGNPLSPTIFNVVMNSFVRHCLTGVTPTEVGTGGLGLTIIDLAAYFYADGGLVASTQ